MAPDIRSVTELTPERLEAWGDQWCIQVDPPTLGLRWQCCPSREVDFWRAHDVPILGCYPCRDGEPWSPATWAKVDERVLVLSVHAYIFAHPGCKRRDIPFTGPDLRSVLRAMQDGGCITYCYYPTGWFSVLGPEGQGHTFSEEEKNRARAYL